jgi:hypothetical protein
MASYSECSNKPSVPERAENSLNSLAVIRCWRMSRASWNLPRTQWGMAAIGYYTRLFSHGDQARPFRTDRGPESLAKKKRCVNGISYLRWLDIFYRHVERHKTSLLAINLNNVSREEYYLLGYNAAQSVESHPTFRRNISPPSSGSKNTPGKKPAWKQVARTARLARLVLFDPEGGDMFLRNVHWLSTDYTALYPRRWCSS